MCVDVCVIACPPHRHVFGGYSSVSWDSPREPAYRACPTAFLFSVICPGLGVEKFPVAAGLAAKAVRCRQDCGPRFGDRDLIVRCAVFDKQQTFSDDSYSEVGDCYVAGKDRGPWAFTGGKHFKPEEVEVLLVEE